MSEQVTVTLPDSLYRCATEWARRCGKSVEEFLAESIEWSMAPLGTTAIPTESWNDAEVLEATSAELPAETDRRLNELLFAQNAGELSETDSQELTRLMQLYQQILLRKAQALEEAVRRGLREPLES